MATPFVQLMGRAGVDTPAGRIDFVPERRYQLLAYLAYARDWVARDRVAFLFWPNTPSGSARGNLRSLVERAREFPWAADLESERHRLRWSAATDVAMLDAALDAVDGAQAAEAVDAVVARYPGPLLQGMEGYDETEFATWLELERGHLAGRVRTVLLSEVDRSAAAGDTARSLEVLDKALALDRLDEEAVQRYLELGATPPWRERARRAYREFVRLLERELELAPAERTRHLAERLERAEPEAPAIRGGPEQAAAAALPPPSLAAATVTAARRVRRHHLPVPPTSFVGREHERAAIAGLLADPDRRLVTIVGAGGIGKTRLALAVAHDLWEHYPDGCWFVRLESITAAEAIPAKVADDLDVVREGSDDALGAVTAHLGERRALLVLDNLEHLLDGAHMLSRLLDACPGLDIVATSRERLNLPEEWIVPVAGLPFPTAPTDAADALTFDAVRLFVERSQRAAPGWTLGDDDAPHVAAISRILDGTPLAIELAAVWVRAMPPIEIEAELRGGLDMLAGATRTAAERHASIRATFEHSWRLLGAQEQEGLRALSIFRGGVTREAAAAVAGVPPPVLATLVDRSILRVSGDGRYETHPLVQGCARTKLAADPDVEARLLERHADHYLRFLIEWGSRLEGPQVGRATSAITRELGNVLAAWRFAIRNVRLRELQETTQPLLRFFALQGLGRRGADPFAPLLDAFGDADTEVRGAVGFAMLSHGLLLPSTSSERHEVMRSGLSLLRPLQDGTGMLWGLYVLGLSAAAAGAREAARQYLDEALALATQASDDRARADCLTNLARLAQDGGDYEAAIAYARDAVRVWQGQHDSHGEAWARTWWGLAALRSGRLDEARLAIERARRSARERGDPLQLALLAAHLGLVHHAMGALEPARVLLLEALGIELGRAEDAFTRPMLLADLARIEVDLGLLDGAAEHVRESLELAEPQGWVGHLVSALAAGAAVRAAVGDAGGAALLAHVVLRHQEAEHVHHEQMLDLLERLRDQLPADDLERARAQGSEERLDEAVTRLAVSLAGPQVATEPSA